MGFPDLSLSSTGPVDCWTASKGPTTLSLWVFCSRGIINCSARSEAFVQPKGDNAGGVRPGKDCRGAITTGDRGWVGGRVPELR